MMVTNQIIVLSGTITFALIIWNLAVSINITRELNKYNIRANIAHRRGLIFKYVRIYKELTVKESGKPGPLYKQFWLSFILFSISLFTGILMAAA